MDEWPSGREMVMVCWAKAGSASSREAIAVSGGLIFAYALPRRNPAEAFPTTSFYCPDLIAASRRELRFKRLSLIEAYAILSLGKRRLRRDLERCRQMAFCVRLS